MNASSIIAGLLAACILAATAHAKGDLIRPTDRIVFIGDSITGQGGRPTGGWMWCIGRALTAVDAANQQTLIPLGGSGQTVFSWGNVERKSRDGSVKLDIKDYDVQTELNQHADVVVIMLGMNDALSPSIKDDEASLLKWKDAYQLLITAVRSRTTPRVLALATPTPCTEDPLSPKNAVMDKLTAHLADLAKEEGAILLPTRATSWEVLDRGRQLDPAFHIIGDQVHPNGIGHLTFAAGMLRGLGEPKAADLLIDEALAKAAAQPVSYQIARQPEGDTPTSLRFRVAVYAKGAATIVAPAGWTVAAVAGTEGAANTFLIDATLDRALNSFEIRSGDDSTTATLPTPWLIGTTAAGMTGWKGGEYDSEKGRIATDELVRTGSEPTAFQVGAEVDAGKASEWRPFVGSLDYGGRGDAATVDFAAVKFFTIGDAGYGLRWVYSDRDRPINLEVSRSGFAGNFYLEVWLNGEEQFSGKPKKDEIPATLRKGWNLLSFKSNYLQWQWQFKVDIKPAGDDSINDLRYRWTPPAAPAEGN